MKIYDCCCLLLSRSVTKYFLMMKLTLILLILTGFQAIALNGSSQSRINLDLKNRSVSEVLKKIESKYEYRFGYNDEVKFSNYKVDVYAKEATIDYVMEQLLRTTPFSYKKINKGLYVIVGHNLDISKFLVVSGKVLDAKGNPLAGASVIEKGTTNGVITNAQGEFVINVTDNQAILVISSVGYQEMEIPVKDDLNPIIALVSNDESLGEIVVVGYGTQRKETLVGSITSVTNKEITTTKNEDLRNMLSGKMPGVRVVQGSAEPGTYNGSLDIRGLGNPLVIVDGVPRPNFERLNPNDIESISVLKDASAAVYGLKAANGVVLITTKKGKRGPAELYYNFTQAWQQLSGMPKAANPVDWMTLWNERNKGGGFGANAIYDSAAFAPYLNGTKRVEDWFGALIRDVFPQSQHNLSVAGGGDNVNYYVGLGYMNQQGMYKSGDLNYTRYNMSSNLNATIKKNIVLDLNLSAIVDEKNQPFQDAWWVIRNIWRQNPTETIFANDDPNYILHTQNEGANPYPMIYKDISGYKKLLNKLFRSSLSVTYNFPFIPGLKAKGMYSYDYDMSDYTTYRKQYNQYRYNATNQTYTPNLLQSPSRLRRDFINTPASLGQFSLNYDKRFNKHNIQLLALVEERARSRDNFFAQRNLSIPLDQIYAGDNNDQQVASANIDLIWKEIRRGYVGRINYGFDNKYLVELSGRYDGSSLNSPAKRWGFFPAALLGYRISEEKFWKEAPGLSFINMLKFRGGYGVTGDDDFLQYQYLAGYNYPAVGTVFNGTLVNGAAITPIPNPHLTWMESRMTNFGVELEAWKGLLGATFEVFKRKRTGLAAKSIYTLPGVIGADIGQENLNSDERKGFELELNHRNRVGELNYSVKAVYSYSRGRNLYVQAVKAGNSYLNWLNNKNDRYNDIWWGYGADGVFQSYDEFFNSSVLYTKTTLPGDYKYLDWNEDGVINSLDSHPISYQFQMPRITYGLTLAAQFRQFDLNMLWQGNAMVNVAYPEVLLGGLYGGAGLEHFMDRWHPVDPNADVFNPQTQWVPGSYAYTGRVPTLNTGHGVQDASFVRLKSVEIGYSIPQNLLSGVNIKEVRVSFSGYNILTFTKLRYVDPEHPSSQFGYLYPMNKTYNLNFAITF